MAAALSLPVVIVQYITSKKEDKQKKADKLEEDKKAFYNDTLDKMLKITNFGEEKRRNRSKIEFKMLQLNSYINSADKREDHDRELFKNAAAVTYFELVAQGIDIQMTEEIDLINVDQLIADLYDIDTTIKETIDTRKDLFNNEAETKYDTVDDAAYAELGRMYPNLIWKNEVDRNGEKKDNEENESDPMLSVNGDKYPRSNATNIYYKTKFENFGNSSDYSQLFTQILINPIFILNDANKELKNVKEQLAALDSNETGIIKNPSYKVNKGDEVMFELPKIFAHKDTLIKATIEDDEDTINIGKTLAELKVIYAKNSEFSQVSTNHRNSKDNTKKLEQKFEWLTFYTMSQKKWNKFLESNESVYKFIVASNEMNKIITFEKNDLKNLIELKDELNPNSKPLVNYRFEFNIAKNNSSMFDARTFKGKKSDSDGQEINITNRDK